MTQSPIPPVSTGRRLALIVDNPRRDLSGLVLLARELAVRGHTVYLVPMNLRQRELPALAPRHLVVNYLRPNNDRDVGNLIDAGIGVSILDTEGAVFREVEALVVKMSRRPEVRGRIATYCAWGSFMSDFLEENGYFRSDQITVTGPPRMDFYADPWRKAAQACSPATRGADGPLVLICGSFPFANSEFQEPEALIAMRVTNTGLPEDQVRREYEKDRAGMEGFIAMSLDLARRLPETSFVYRPHPFERVSTYARPFDGVPNLQVAADGPVDGWILRSSAVIQPSDCTTGVEAAFAGVPALVPGWVRVDEVPVVTAVSRICPDLDELTRAVSAALDGAIDATDGAEDLIDSLFGAQDGKAHLRVADAIELAAAADVEIDVDRLRRLHYQPHGDAPLITRSMERVKETLGLPATWSIRSRTETAPVKWDGGRKAFGVDEVGKLLGALDSVDPIDRPVRAVAATAADYRFGFGVGRSIRIDAGS